MTTEMVRRKVPEVLLTISLESFQYTVQRHFICNAASCILQDNYVSNKSNKSEKLTYETVMAHLFSLVDNHRCLHV